MSTPEGGPRLAVGEALRVIAGPAAGAEIPLGRNVAIGRAVDGPGNLPDDHESVAQPRADRDARAGVLCAGRL